MSTFVATNKAPGVYIEEVQLPGAITGVGTSTAAFVGPAKSGLIGEPVRLANWTQFLEAFGLGANASPFITQPPVYVTHAVQGFFAEGGSDCWFVRVGTAKRAELLLKDRGGGAGTDTLVVRAKEEGVAGNAIPIEVKDASIAPPTNLARPTATVDAAMGEATATNADDAKKFVAGDVVHIDDGTNSEDATVGSVSGATIRFESSLQNAYANTPLRLADVAAGAKRLHLDSTAGIEPGSALVLTQDGTTEAVVVASADPLGIVALDAPLANGYGLDAGDPAVTVQSQEFAVVIGSVPFDKLSMDPRHSRYFARIVDSDDAELLAADSPSPEKPPDDRPRVIGPTNLQGGTPDDPGAALLNANAFKAGIDALRKIDEVNLLCVPDRADQDVQAYMIEHCVSLQDRFAILDPPPRATPAQIRAYRDAIPGGDGVDKGFAALYYPRIVISDPITGDRMVVPPSGHLAGLYARVDNTRGVSKAPANEGLRRALDLELRLGDEDQGPLNENQVNVIRFFPGRGFRVWGARTLSKNTQWRYVNVRRLLLFIEESIQESTQFVVFEPNDIALWAQVKRTVSEFLTRLWTAGALVGATAEQAFRVRVDEELNPPSTRELGILVIEVRVAPTTPAEFVVFRIIQQPGRPLVEE